MPTPIGFSEKSMAETLIRNFPKDAKAKFFVSCTAPGQYKVWSSDAETPEGDAPIVSADTFEEAFAAMNAFVQEKTRLLHEDPVAFRQEAITSKSCVAHAMTDILRFRK